MSNSFFLDPHQCPDLQIKLIRIIIRNADNMENSVLLAYTQIHVVRSSVVRSSVVKADVTRLSGSIYLVRCEILFLRVPLSPLSAPLTHRLYMLIARIHNSSSLEH